MPDQLEQPTPNYAQIELRVFSSSTTRDDMRKIVHELMARCEVLEGRRIWDHIMMKPHRVMTPEEYAAMPIVGWHQVCRDVDGFGAIGLRYLGE